jgi:hypothetical protein
VIDDVDHRLEVVNVAELFQGVVSNQIKKIGLYFNGFFSSKNHFHS